KLEVPCGRQVAAPTGAVEHSAAPVGVDAFIDPCRASGLVPADGQWPPLRVRWNIRQHPVGVDAHIDPRCFSGLAAATKKTLPDGSVFLLEPYSCSSAMTLSMRR